jgi:diaminopimelate decarboxylase
MTAHLRHDELLPYIAGKTLASPCYVYDLQVVLNRAQYLQKLMPTRARAYFAMKCNHVSEVLSLLAREKFGVDLVSGGEWLVARQNGFAAEDVIFSGVGKTVAEIDEAILLRFGQINVESLPELDRIVRRARELRMTARLSLRLNLGIATNTHPHISTGNLEHKFGLPLSQLSEAVQKISGAKEHVQWIGISAHVGSQIAELETFQSVLEQLLGLRNQLAALGHKIEVIDCGGGWAIDYHQDRMVFPIPEWLKLIERAADANPHLNFQFEPGRWLVAPAGGLLAQVEYVKRTPTRNFLIVNTGMHHLIRPALYGAYHRISHARSFGSGEDSTVRWNESATNFSAGDAECFDVVGPICESTDVLARDRWFVQPEEGDWILIKDAGAYGEVMASHYNLQQPIHRMFLK